jgi:hypothetical protein
MTTLRRHLSSLLAVLLLPSALLCAQSTDWQATLRSELPLLGHRNWILVVDSAYPLQVSPGVELLETNTSQLEVTAAVLSALDHSTHVKPVIYLDAELPLVPSSVYPELSTYRDSLKQALAGRSAPRSLPHEKILNLISQAGKDYKILVLKTTMTMPYTSVFFQLGCKYCTDEVEQEIREGMKSAVHK